MFTIKQATRAGKRLDAIHRRAGGGPGNTWAMLAALGVSVELAHPAAVQLEQKTRAVVTEMGGDEVSVAQSCWLDGLMYGIALAQEAHASSVEESRARG